MDAGVYVVVKGLVQGVGFRYFVFHRASRLGLRGRVKNLYNGDVEIEATGDRSLLEEFLKEVKIGPRAAQVTELSVDWKQPDYSFHHFEIA
jgi:acylphosphatase